MCGIVGYVGPQDAGGLILDGLGRLEYRGYDSAGVAVCGPTGLEVRRARGKLAALRERIRREPLQGRPGIGHTRWATHGKPSDENAHPHTVGGVSVVHNGIIENSFDLREELVAEGRAFTSETDTEIFAHLIRRARERGAGSLEQALRSALSQVRGTYALLVLGEQEPDRLLVAKNASPLVVGLGEGETFVASDVPAILPHTRRVVFLEEGELGVVTAAGLTLTTLAGEPVTRPPKTVAWSLVQAERGGHKHFMLKEIFEQPRAVADTLRGRFSVAADRVTPDGIGLAATDLARIQRLVLLGCGTSWHAALVARLFIESFARLPTEVELAHEFRLRDPVIGPDTLVIGVSQSGETADTLAALRLAREAGSRLLGVCNVVDSSLARLCDDVLYTHAGPEIGVASTKAFTSAIAALALLALYLGQERGVLGPAAIRSHLESLIALPEEMDRTLKQLDAPLRLLARRYLGAQHFLFLGRGLNYPIALEGALKLKEISYIHAEGYAAGEMKHGPIALIDETMPVLVLAPRGSGYEKIVGNLQETKARGAKTLAVVTVGDKRIADVVDDLIQVPDVAGFCQPLVTVLPLQLLAYHTADLRGTDVDQPRNLAKSVTVE